MDVQLPGIDGYETTRRIKADPALRSIPIIAVTSYALSGEEKKARAAGCDDYVPKPYSPRQLLAKIRQYLHPGQTLGLLRAKWSLMALFDRRSGSPVWSLSGEERTSDQTAKNDVPDPKRSCTT